MHTATKKTKHAHPIRHLQGNGHHAYKRSSPLTHKIENLYAHSIKRVKRKPYQAVGILLGLGFLSSYYLWYRMTK
jgi:hypothetical protein